MVHAEQGDVEPVDANEIVGTGGSDVEQAGAVGVAAIGDCEFIGKKVKASEGLSAGEVGEVEGIDHHAAQVETEMDAPISAGAAWLADGSGIEQPESERGGGRRSTVG